jgi:arylsulfatase A-like enzyme
VTGSDRPKNVIVVMTDQQRADLCAREGFPVDTTPTVDFLAGRGCWFDRAYTTSPVCVPARVSLLTGRYPSAHGVRSNADLAQRPRYERDLFDVLRGAGYRTALLGKNHSHVTPDRVDLMVEYGHLGRTPPAVEGESGAELDRWLRGLGPRTSLEPTPFPAVDQSPHRLVDHTVDWLTSEDTPAFAWLSIPEPHVPYQVPEPYFSTYSPDVVPAPTTGPDDIQGRSFAWQYVAELARRSGEADPEVLRRARASYLGMMRLVDDALARLVDHLERADQLEQTLFVVCADHGDFAGDYGLMRKGPEIPEVLTRIPLVLSGWGVAASPGPSPAHVSLVDVLPTVCDLLGLKVPDGVQGRSLAHVVAGDRAAAEACDSVFAEQGTGGRTVSAEELAAAEGGPLRRARESNGLDTVNVVTQRGTRRMVRQGRWKVVVHDTGQAQLYDLADDPFELRDLAVDDEHAATLATMLELLRSWTEQAAAEPAPAG